MYLLNLVFGETYCTLNCDYCMYTKKFDRIFEKQEILNFKFHIKKLKNFVYAEIPELKIISITWWEPTLFPEIIKEFYKSFPDKIIRISTNWTILHKINLENFDNKRIFFSISLDWMNLKENIFRFKNKNNLDNILNNIDFLLKKWFNVEILTVLHYYSFVGYLNLINFFEKKYKKEIEEKKLWSLPFELVNYLNLKKFDIKEKIILNFLIELKNNLNNYKILKNYKEYFLELIKFYETKNIESCNMYNWALHIKYLNNTLWTNWNFLLYWCWSRGKKILWQMNLKDLYEEKLIMERIKSKNLEKYFKESKICENCFTNWHFYWLISKNKLSNIPKILNYD